MVHPNLSVNRSKQPRRLRLMGEKRWFILSFFRCVRGVVYFLQVFCVCEFFFLLVVVSYACLSAQQFIRNLTGEQVTRYINTRCGNKEMIALSPIGPHEKSDEKVRFLLLFYFHVYSRRIYIFSIMWLFIHRLSHRSNANTNNRSLSIARYLLTIVHT